MSKIASHSPASLWKNGDWPQFSEDLPSKSCDVCIVGAGIAGLTSAYFMSMEGLRVTVLEAAAMPGEGETGNTSAHLSSALDDRFTRLEELFGEEGSFLAAESHRWAIDIVESICLRENMDCGFERVDGYLFTTDPEEHGALRLEFAAAQRAGFTDIELLPAPPLKSRRTGSSIRFPNQGQLHPLQYLKGLATAVQKYGGRILMNHEVMEIHGHSPYQITTRQGAIFTAAHVVISTNTPFNNRFVMHTKQAAYRTYILVFAIESGSIRKALYWDMKDPYHYVRLYQPNEHQTLLIVGGEDHKTGQCEDPDSRFARLENWARANFPEAGAVVTRWSGQVLEPVDSLAFIGRNPGDQEIYIATGDSGHGLTHGTIAGMLLNDLVHKRNNPWEKLYDPSRKATSFGALKEYFRENINVALQYRDYFSPADLERPGEVALGEGAIVREALQKLAVYRDHDNELHVFSAICPHLGGIVRWNKVEKTWDCPCHGSRFSCKGEVINGPAMKNLEKMDAP